MSNQWIAYIVMGIGLIFELLGVLGLIRLPDLYSRLQAAVKCVTFGSAVILLGVFVFFGFNSSGYKALLGMGIILVTAPVSAHAIARAAYRRQIALTEARVNDELPVPAYADPTEFPLKED
jgi:multicomponent Na+:H+ antiporter subunit G